LKQATYIIQYNEEGLVLMLKRPADHKYPNQWTLPGGKVEEGEAPEVCAWREMMEETGVKLKIFEAVPFFLGGSKAVIYTYASGLTIGDDAITREFPNREHSEYGWFDIDDLPEGTPDIIHMLFQYLSEQM